MGTFLSEFQGFLTRNGLTESVLIGFLLFFSAILFFSAREFLSWYLRLNHMKKELTGIQNSLKDLEEQFSDFHKSIDQKTNAILMKESFALNSQDENTSFATPLQESPEEKAEESFPISH